MQWKSKIGDVRFTYLYVLEIQTELYGYRFIFHDK